MTACGTKDSTESAVRAIAAVQSLGKDHVAVLEQDWIQGRFDLWIARLERGARRSVDLALLGRQWHEHRHGGGTVNIHRGQCTADVIAASRLPLFLQSRRQHAQ